MKIRNIACILLVAAALCACGKAGGKGASGEAGGEESDRQTMGEEDGSGIEEDGWQTVGREEVGTPGNDEGAAKGDGENPGSSGETPANQASDIPSGNVLEGLVRVGEDSPYYCTTEANVRLCYLYDSMQWRCNLVCRDPVYGITYYVNYGRDNCIYALRDEEAAYGKAEGEKSAEGASAGAADAGAGTSQLAVPIPATELYCRDGRLYFIAESYPKTPTDLDGCILCYDPADGSVKAVTEQKAERMNVYPDGIILNGYVGDKWKTCYYSFEAKALTELNRYGRDRVGEYRMIAYERKDPDLSENEKWIYVLADAQENVVKEFTPLTCSMTETQLALEMFRIEGNVLYYRQSVYKDGVRNKNWSFMEYHTDTGECRALYPMRTDAWYESQLMDFIMYDGLALFTSGYCLDLATGESTLLEWHDRPEMTDYSHYVEKQQQAALYTDGKRLFYLYDEKLYLLELRKKKTAETIRFMHDGGEMIELIYQYEAHCSQLGE